jgi:porphobilinogen synthase
MSRYPAYRPRRLRRSDALRRLVRETRVTVEQLVQPLFVVPGRNVATPIESMPGIAQLSVDRTAEECRRLADLGVPAVLLFGVPEHKDARGSGATAADGIIPRALEAIRRAAPRLLLLTDVCLCEYTDHGHCGVLRGDEVDNDATLPVLAAEALAHARAGADVVAPSDMMDGRVGAIRRALDEAGFAHVPIMSYAAKFASALYGPFRDAAGSTPQFGDRRGYQMDPGNAEEALREVALDVEEGADIVMVKPAVRTSTSCAA